MVCWVQQSGWQSVAIGTEGVIPVLGSSAVTVADGGTRHSKDRAAAAAEHRGLHLDLDVVAVVVALLIVFFFVNHSIDGGSITSTASLLQHSTQLTDLISPSTTSARQQHQRSFSFS